MTFGTALQEMAGKTVEKVELIDHSDELSVTIRFTDKTSFSIMNVERPRFSLMYAYGPADNETVEQELGGHA